MSHLDEGALHRYLDGQEEPSGIREKNIERHLAACIECRVALDEVRGLKDRAGAILAEAQPDFIDAPPFSTLARRAEAEPAPAPQRPGWNVTPLAAAAMLILAVATGWSVRGIWTGDGWPTVADNLLVTDPIAATPPPGPELPAEGAGSPTVGAADPFEQEQAVGPPTVTDAPAVDPPRPITAAVESVARRDEARAIDAADIPAPREMVAAPSAAIAPGRFEMSEVWTPASADAAREHLGTELASVPELAVVSYATGLWGGDPAVRIVQTLSDADSLELIITRVIETGENRARAAAGATLLSVRRGDLVIRARGTVSQDSLGALLAQITAP